MICYTPFLPTGYGVPKLSELFFGPIQLPTTTKPGRPISFGMNISEKHIQLEDGRVFKSGQLSKIVFDAVGNRWERASQIAKRADISIQHLSGIRYALLKHTREGTVLVKKQHRQTVYKRNPSSGAISVV